MAETHTPADLRVGDTFTIGWDEKVRNPQRRWFQFWKPRLVDGPPLKRFVVTHCG